MHDAGAGDIALAVGAGCRVPEISGAAGFDVAGRCAAGASRWRISTVYFSIAFLTHAALFESVEWCKHSEGARQSGLVNAVLRKVAALQKTRAFDAEQAYPQWMVARWKKFYGAEACRRICEQGQMEAGDCGAAAG